VLFDGWYVAWHCHAATTLFVSICLGAVADFPTNTCESLRGRRFPYSDLQSCVRELVHTIQQTGLLHPSGSYQKDNNGTLTSMGSMWSVLKYGCAAVIISQPVFQAFDTVNLHRTALRNVFRHRYEVTLHLVHGFHLKNRQMSSYDLERLCHTRAHVLQ
jgi:hypothetical protein